MDQSLLFLALGDPARLHPFPAGGAWTARSLRRDHDRLLDLGRRQRHALPAGAVEGKEGLASPPEFSMRRFLSLALLLLLLGAQTRTRNSTAARVEVGKNILVSADEPYFPHVEPHLAANPKDARQLVAATMVFSHLQLGSTIEALATFDGGQSWTRSPLAGLENLKVSDPWVAFGPDGAAYLACLPFGLPRQEPQSKEKALLFVFRSSDGGRSWSRPVQVPFGKGGSYDRPTLVTDMSHGKYQGRVYVNASQASRSKGGRRVFAVSVSRSTDAGRSFSDPAQLLPNNFNNQNGNLVVLSDGTLVVPILELGIMDADGTQRQLAAPRFWTATSNDGGESFSNPCLVTEFYPGTSPHLAADLSGGAFRDRLYAVWAGRTGHIVFSLSMDAGETWSDPTPIDQSPDQQGDKTPTVAVNKEGVIGVAWHDRTSDAERKCSDVFFRASLDGGKTFQPRVRVSTTSSCPDSPGNQFPTGSNSTVGQRWPTGGDYMGFTADANGLFHLLWSDSRTGVYQSWTTTVRVHSASTR